MDGGTWWVQAPPGKCERTAFLVPFVCNGVQGLPTGVIPSCMLGLNSVTILRKGFASFRYILHSLMKYSVHALW